MRLKWRVPALVAGLCSVLGLAAAADQAFLKDGSILVGSIHGLAEGKLRVETSFGGELAIPWDQVTGISTEGALVVGLASGARVTGVLNAADGQQFVHGIDLGETPLVLVDVITIWPEGQEPAPKAAEPAPAPAPPAPKPPWTGRAELGLNGQSGNKDRIDIRGGIDLNRKYEARRINLYLKGQYSETNSARSANEIMGGTRLEFDFSERTYVFGKLDLEYDEFEDLDLRATLTAGMGHFFVKREKLELKGWAGAGFEYEAFDRKAEAAIPASANFEAALREALHRALYQRFQDTGGGAIQSNTVVELGYAFRQDVKKNFRFKHGLAYYPSVSDSFGEYRLAADTALEFPLGKDPDWTMRTGVRHEYDSAPREGVDTLDTTYYLNLGYNW